MESKDFKPNSNEAIEKNDLDLRFERCSERIEVLEKNPYFDQNLVEKLKRDLQESQERREKFPQGIKFTEDLLSEIEPLSESLLRMMDKPTFVDKEE